MDSAQMHEGPEDLLEVAEVLEYVGVGRTSWNKNYQPFIPCLRQTNGKRVWRRADIDAYLKEKGLLRPSEVTRRAA